MPLYQYQCPMCKFETLELMRMCAWDEAPVVPCPVCERLGTYLPMVRQITAPHTDLQDYARPIEMYSVACNSSREIREMQDAGVPVSDDPSDPMYGVPVARNRSEKKKALKVVGFVETN